LVASSNLARPTKNKALEYIQGLFIFFALKATSTSILTGLVQLKSLAHSAE